MTKSLDIFRAIITRLATGESDTISFNNDDLNEEDCQTLAKAIREAPRVYNFRPSNTKFANFPLVCEALAERSDIKEIDVSYGEIKPEDFTGFADVVRNQPNLESLNVSGVYNTPAETLRDIGDAMQGKELLRWASLTYMGVTDEVAHDISQTLTALPKLGVISFQHNPVTDAIVPDVVHLLATHPQVTSVLMNGTQISEYGWAQICNACSHAPHPNLSHLQPPRGLDASASAIVEHNKARADAAVQLLRESRSRTLGLDEAWAIHEREPLIVSRGGFRQLPRFHTEYLNKIPELPEGETPTLAALLHPNTAGLCPIDNPCTWHAHPDLLAQLAQRGELTEATLSQTSPQGYTLVDYAFHLSPDVRQSLQVLNNIGIQFQNDQLFTEDGQPSAMLQTLTDRGQAGALFTLDNWLGAHPREVKAAMEQLSEAAQAGVPNKHSFLAEFGKQHCNAARER